VLSSLLVARLLTPMMAAYFLPGHSRQEVQSDGLVMRSYLRALEWCLAHPKTTAITALAFFLGSLALIPLVPKGLIPPADRGYLNVSIELPTGSSLDHTMAVAKVARRSLEGIAGIESVFTTAGDPQQAETGSVSPGEVRKGSLILKLTDRKHRASQTSIETVVRERLSQVPGARFSLGTGGPGEKMQLILSSDNASALKNTAEQLERGLRTIPHLFNITSSATVERPEIVVKPDMRRAAERGITTQAIGDAVRVATNGDFDAQAPRLNLDTRQIYIRVRVADLARQDLGTLQNVRVVGREGPVPLSSIAHLSLESGPAEIDRYDRHRFISVNADLGGLPLGTAQAASYELPAVKNMPSEVRLIQTGDAELAADLGAGFGMAVLVGILSVYCVLVLLFKDFLQPLTILSAIPLSLGGAFVALLLVHSQLSVPSMIGLVMLIGIVTKNSILLVEYAIVGRRDRQLSLHDAIIDACHKRSRPIVMTTVAMMAGMLPIALGWGADASFRQPMAVAVIGGLFTSTALSLLVVPVVYTYVDRFERFLSRLRKPRRAVVPDDALGTAVRQRAVSSRADY
jgi:multidrug efflux pump subunit AcrB